MSVHNTQRHVILNDTFKVQTITAGFYVGSDWQCRTRANVEAATHRGDEVTDEANVHCEIWLAYTWVSQIDLSLNTSTHSVTTTNKTHGCRRDITRH